MKDKKILSLNTIERTAELVKSIKNHKGNNAHREAARRFLKLLGINFDTVETSSGKSVRVFFEFEPEGGKIRLSPATQRIAIYAYKNAIYSLKMKSPEYGENIKKAITKLKKATNNDVIINGLKPENNMDTIRSSLKTAYKKYSRNKSVTCELNDLMPEMKSYYVMADAFNSISDIKNKQDVEILYKKHQSKIQINSRLAIKVALDAITRRDSTAFELVAAMAILTGRRITEIIKTGSFKKHTDYSVMFSGQLKTSTRNDSEQLPEYEIPVFCKPEDAVKTLKKIQSKLASDILTYPDVDGTIIEARTGSKKLKFNREHTRAVSKRYPAPVSAVLKDWFDSAIVSSKTFRSLYSEIAFRDYVGRDGEKPTEIAFTARILGHGEGDIKTALNYKTVVINDKIKNVDEGDGAKNKPVDAGLVEWLKEKTDEINSMARSMAIQRLHAEVIRLSAGGKIFNRTELDVTRLRKINVGGKITGKVAAEKYFEILNKN